MPSSLLDEHKALKDECSKLKAENEKLVMECENLEHLLVETKSDCVIACATTSIKYENKTKKLNSVVQAAREFRHFDRSEILEVNTSGGQASRFAKENTSRAKEKLFSAIESLFKDEDLF